MYRFALIVIGSVVMTHNAHAQHHDHHGSHGNPEDLAAYVAKMEDPARDDWQKPSEVIQALGVAKGQTVCDIGVGPGYFALKIARIMGQTGHVFAVDVEPRILEVLRDRIATSGQRNITPVLALPDHALVPHGACDLVLVVDTYHHFPDGPAYLRQLTSALKPGGRIANIDFHKRELPVGPPVDHKIAREDFLKQAEAAGLKLVTEPTFLPYQYFLILKPR
jgi:ubiquinone/menaquinone biosynthesis C-methylase UbiE